LQQPSAQSAGELGTPIGETGSLECRCGNLAWPVEIVKPRGEHQVFEDGEIIVQQRLVGEKTN
jgi:hypothetical protein